MLSIQFITHLPLVGLLITPGFWPLLCPVLAEYRGQITQVVMSHFCGLAFPGLAYNPPLAIRRRMKERKKEAFKISRSEEVLREPLLDCGSPRKA
jgi:hypothetical protein